MNAIPVPELEIVPMLDSDLDAVVAIESDIYSFPWTPGNFRDALRAGYFGWIARVGDEVIGYAIMMLAIDEMHLLNISIAGRRQRRGFGARLLHHVMAVAARHGAGSILLEVRPSNRRALELYRNFGFEQIGVRRGYYPATIGREDAVILRKSLGVLTA